MTEWTRRDHHRVLGFLAAGCAALLLAAPVALRADPGIDNDHGPSPSLPDSSPASDPPDRFLCPACSIGNAVLAYEDHWKRVFRCLQCSHLWHTGLTRNAPASLKPASSKS